MRELVCHHRGAATAQFMAEVEDMAIPVGSAPTGIPLLDTLGGAQQQQINVKDIARLPRPHFAPVPVYVGRAPGYAGPVARTRAPGAPVGEQPDLTAYAPQQSEPGDADASPISHAASDAASLRRGGKRAALARAAHAAKANKTAAKPDSVAKARAVARTASKPARAKAATGAARSKAAGARTAAPKAAPKVRGSAEQGKS